MGLMGFIKRLLEPEEVVPKIDVSDPQKWLVLMEKEFVAQEKEVLALIKNHVAHARAELKEKLPALEAVDISEKKVENKVKIIVRTNKDNYVHQVKIFMKSLDFAGTLEEVVEQINSVFLELYKASNVSYQKATYLVGKEMGDIHEIISELSRNLKKAVPEQLVVTSRTITSVKNKLAEVSATEKLINKLTKKVTVLEKNIKDAKAKEKERVAAWKNSEEYLALQQLKKDNARYEKELSAALVSLKSKIDFKALGNVFHSSKKMSEVNAYKKNFGLAFGKGNNLQALLREAKLDTQKDLVLRINELKKLIKEPKTVVVKETPIDTHELVVEKKKLEKLEKNNELVEQSIREELDAYAG